MVAWFSYKKNLRRDPLMGGYECNKVFCFLLLHLYHYRGFALQKIFNGILMVHHNSIGVVIAINIFLHRNVAVVKFS